MRTRLRKADRIKQAGKGCNKAQYGFGATKRPSKVFNTHPKENVQAVEAWAEKHSTAYLREVPNEEL